jgi:hypothetical protein
MSLLTVREPGVKPREALRDRIHTEVDRGGARLLRQRLPQGGITRKPEHRIGKRDGILGGTFTPVPQRLTMSAGSPKSVTT